jgi:hypothetical protein
LDLALGAVGGVDSVLGRELGRLADDFGASQTVNQLCTPLNALNVYLKNIQ